MKRSCVGVIIFIVCLIFMGNKPVNKINAENGWKDYKINEVDLYNETNTYTYNFIENDDEPNQYFDMTTYEEKSISTGEPLITVLTPGLGSYANTWSLTDDGKGNVGFSYLDDSIITRLSNVVGEANIYWYYLSPSDKKISIIDINEQNKKIKEGTLSFYSIGQSEVKDELGNDRIMDITKPIIILFQPSNPGASNDYVYEEFNYVISKVVYDVKCLNNGVLPKLNLIGHSRGGLTNLQYALDHPNLVHSMYSIGTPYLGSTSATIDVGIGGVFGYVSAGEKNIVNKDIYELC